MRQITLTLPLITSLTMPFSVVAIIGALMMMFYAVSCDVGSVARVCEPSTQEGCKEGERCTLSPTSSPICLPSQPNGYAEGALCEGSESCADGLACVENFGLKRCVRFCPLDVSQEEGDARCAELNLQSRCLLSLPERTDIGFCVSPCVPDSLAEAYPEARCPEGDTLSCQLSLDLPLSVCAPAGEGEQGEACDLTERCERGLMCFGEGATSRCLKPLSEGEPCPPHHLKRMVRGHINFQAETPYQACWPSLSLPQASVETRYRLYLEPLTTAQEREARCEAWGARLASPAELSDEDLLTSLAPTLNNLLTEHALIEGLAEPYQLAWLAPAEGSCALLSLSVNNNEGSEEVEGSASQLSVKRYTLSDPRCEQPGPSVCARSPVGGRL